ncbi:hypothetical protein Pelo_1299 [Pelomyxa schiedti]|nr:hypothetical protein Pelo_1299 [Pelomyxa schiedti]
MGGRPTFGISRILPKRVPAPGPVTRSRPKEKKGEEGQDDKDGERAIPRGRHELRPEKLPQGETRGKEMRVRTTRREVRRGRYLEVAMSYARKKICKKRCATEGTFDAICPGEEISASLMAQWPIKMGP